MDHASPHDVRGWVYDNRDEDKPVTIEIYRGNTLIGTMVADAFRKDLQQAEKGNGRHAFHFVIPAHERKSADNVSLRVRVQGKRWWLPNGGPVPMQRFFFQLQHTLEYGEPHTPFEFSEPSPRPDDEKICERLIAAYLRAQTDDPNRRNRLADVWATRDYHYHRKLSRILKSRNAPRLATYLQDAHNRGITYGITQDDRTTAVLRQNLSAQHVESIRFKGNLVSLPEFLGLLHVESPEHHGRWGEHLHEDAEDLIHRISAKLGVSVVSPQVIGSLFGLRTSNGILSARDLLALYAAIRIKDLCRQHRIDSSDICEIGGGLGGVAYFSAVLGLGRFTIVDLSLVNVLQGYYLLRTLPSDVRVRLYGEPEAKKGERVVSVLPT